MSPRIAGGAETGAFPEVGLFLTDVGECSVTLVGCQTAVTAAHCVCEATGAGNSCGSGGTFVIDPSVAAAYWPNAGFFPIDSIAVDPQYNDLFFDQGGDIAVLRLGAPVRGLPPRAINEVADPATIGAAGVIVGYGGADTAPTEAGLRRSGNVLTTFCSGVPQSTHVCWNSMAPGYANTCAGDSGGALLMNLGSGYTLSGVTSGGVPTACQVGGSSFDTNVFHYSQSFLRPQAGADLSSTTCGDGAQAGDPGTTLGFSGTVTSSVPWAFQVPSGTKLLRVGLNGGGAGDADLYVRPGSPVSPPACSSAIAGSYEFCEIPDPAPGTWYATIDTTGGSVTYQLAITFLPPDPAPPPLVRGSLVVSSFTSDEIMTVDPHDAGRSVASSRLRGAGPDLTSPEGIALEPGGSVLVANPGNRNVVRVDPASGDRQLVSGCADAACSSTLGSGPAFLAPRFLALPGDGSVLVADRSNPGVYAVVRVDPVTGNRSVVSGCADASCTLVVGSGPAIARLFDVAVEASGQIVVVDGQALYRIDPATGNRSIVSGCVDAACTSIVGSGPISGQPSKILVGAPGSLLVTYRVDGSTFGAIRSVDPTSGARTTISGCDDAACASVIGGGPTFTDPFGLVFALDRSLLVADGRLEAIVRVDPQTGDRSVVSGCADASCSSEVGAGPIFGDALGLAVVPEPGAAAAGGAALAALAALGRIGIRAARLQTRNGPG